MGEIRLVAFSLDALLADGEAVGKSLRAASVGERPNDLGAYLATAKLAQEASDALDILKRYGVHRAIVSTAWEFAVTWFAERLGVGLFAGTTLGPDGRMRHLGPEDQGPWLAQLADQLDVPLSETAAVGATEADLGMLQLAGTGFYLGPAHPMARGLVCFPRNSLFDVALRIVEPLRNERPKLLIF